MGSHPHSPSLEHQNSDGGIRKRVCKACDRCRLKKSKCDGSNPCGRCRADNAICVFGERKKAHDKVYPKGYVEMLEHQQAQLVTGLQELYKRAINGQGWLGAALADSTNGNPLTHDILERLGALKHESNDDADSFEEDLNTLQHRLIASGSGFMQRAESPDDSEGLRSPVIEASPVKQPSFSDPFSPRSQLPLTPPEESPYPSSGPQISIQTNLPQSLFQPTPRGMSLNPAVLQQQNWSPALTDLDESLYGFDTMGSFDPSMVSQYPATSMSMYPMGAGNLPPSRDWTEDEVFRSYFNPTLA